MYKTYRNYFHFKRNSLKLNILTIHVRVHCEKQITARYIIFSKLLCKSEKRYAFVASTGQKANSCVLTKTANVNWQSRTQEWGRNFCASIFFTTTTRAISSFDTQCGERIKVRTFNIKKISKFLKLIFQCVCHLSCHCPIVSWPANILSH